MFVSLHGWGEDLEMFLKFWTSDELKDEFIHLSIKSSQILGSRRYEWTDIDQSKDEIHNVIRTIKPSYNINETALIGGFSQGGTVSMILAMENPEIFNGFVALNPSNHDRLTQDLIENASTAKQRGTIIIGDEDNQYQNQHDMMATFNALGLGCELYLNKGFGHWFPENLSEKIDQSVLSILG